MNRFFRQFLLKQALVRAAVVSWFRSLTPLSVLVLAPGFVLVFAGAALIMAPELAIPLLAIFLVVAGIAACAGAWRLVLLKRRAEAVLKQVEVRVTVQASRAPTPFELVDEALLDSKKVMLH